MRRGSEPSFMEANGKVIAINLSADYCAEHECGIPSLRRAFGIPGTEKKVGIQARTITTLPPEFGFGPVKGGAALWWHKHYGNKGEHPLANYIDTELRFYGDRTIAAAWNDGIGDSGSFAVRVTEKHAAVLTEFAEAFKRHDVAIWLGGGGVFQNAGLVIAIASRVPADLAAKMKEGDEDRRNMLAASKATGIEAELTKAGKNWFALSPGWKHDEDKTAFSVAYWLNPMEQDRYNAGWFTVEQLREWAVDKGPVMKSSRDRR